MIEKDSAHRERIICLAVIAGQIETANFTDSIAGTRMEGREFCLRNLVNFTEHFARSGKVEPALRNGLAQRRKKKVRAIDVGIQSGEFVVEGITDEALGGQMITFVRENSRDYLKQAGEALNRSCVKGYFASHLGESCQAVRWILQSHPPDDSMDLVTLRNQKFSQIGAILTRDAGYQRTF